MEQTETHILLDAARMDGLIYQAQEISEENRCLYEGESKALLGSSAPWLFKLEPYSEFSDWLSEHAPENSWGVIIISQAETEALYRHLRQFLIVQKEDGKELYFRYYDPRVLRDFLPTCDPEQLQEFFGPIDAFVLEDEDAKMIQFTLDGTALKRKKLKMDLEEFLHTGYELEVNAKAISEAKDDKPKGSESHWEF